jgi:hypothetical protein
LCARFGDGVGGLSLENIAKDWLGFLPLSRRVSQDTSCVLVHGYSSCDLGILQPLCCCKMVMVQFMLNGKKMKNASAYHKIQQGFVVDWHKIQFFFCFILIVLQP